MIQPIATTNNLSFQCSTLKKEVIKSSIESVKVSAEKLSQPISDTFSKSKKKIAPLVKNLKLLINDVKAKYKEYNKIEKVEDPVNLPDDVELLIFSLLALIGIATYITAPWIIMISRIKSALNK